MADGPRQIGRYAMYGVLASGGMATVHLGRLAGAAGFVRTVAIKALRPQYAEDPEFVSMFIDEARLAARIHHPNVVPTLDVVSNENELFTVMDYVHGETLSRLVRASRSSSIPLGIVTAVMRDVLKGLHAAHEATDEHGESLGVVHRDVSPQNVIVGADGVARVLDFGVAKAAGRIQTTREGQLKGKLAYMAPEQYHGVVTRQTDVFAASVVLWEALVGDKLFSGNEGEIVAKILHRPIPTPREKRPDLPAVLEEIVMRGLAREPSDRFQTALEMSDALVKAQAPATTADVGAWVTSLAAETLQDRQTLIREMETEPRISPSVVLPVLHEAATRTDLTSDDIKPKSHPRRRWLIMLGLSAIAVAGLSVSRLRRESPPSNSITSNAAISSSTNTAIATAIENLSTEAGSEIRAMPPSTATAAITSTARASAGRAVVPSATVHHVTVKAADSAATAPDHI